MLAWDCRRTTRTGTSTLRNGLIRIGRFIATTRITLRRNRTGRADEPLQSARSQPSLRIRKNRQSEDEASNRVFRSVKVDLLLVEPYPPPTGHPMQQDFFRKLVGQWEGTCKTWFEPDQLADESAIKGECRFLFGEKFLRHQYQSTLQGRARNGEETIVFNPANMQIEIAWIDDFHMRDAIMLSSGNGLENDHGFSVVGSYEVGTGHPAWRWRTIFELKNADRLVMTAINISPDGDEAKALETNYKRIAS